MVVSTFTKVVFPEPLGPRKPKILPVSTRRSMPSTALTSVKYLAIPWATMLRSPPSLLLRPSKIVLEPLDAVHRAEWDIQGSATAERQLTILEHLVPTPGPTFRTQLLDH